MKYQNLIQKLKPKYAEAKWIIVECHKAGMTSREIRDKYHITKSNLNNQLRMLNIKLKPVSPNWGGRRNNV